MSTLKLSEAKVDKVTTLLRDRTPVNVVHDETGVSFHAIYEIRRNRLPYALVRQREDLILSGMKGEAEAVKVRLEKEFGVKVKDTELGRTYIYPRHSEQIHSHRKSA